MLAAPLLLGLLDVAVMHAFGAAGTGNPVRTTLAALVRLGAPSLRSDSWGPMLSALDYIRAHGADDLYATLFFEQHEKFQYPPTSLLWLDALRVMLPVTPRLLNAVNGGVFVINAALCGLLCARLLAGREKSCVPPALLAGLLSLVFWPVVYGFTIGQVQVWIDALFTAALLLWLGDRRLAAGIAIGLACTLKPQLGLLLPWAVLWREWRFAGGLAGTLGAAFGVSLLRYGLPVNLQYLDVLAALSRTGESFRANQSVNGLVNRSLGNGNNLDWSADSFPPYSAAVRWATMLAGLLLTALPFTAGVRLRREGRAGLADLSAAALCFTMASPIAWEHHYGIALPMFVVAFCALARQQGARRAALLFAWCLVGSNLQVFSLVAGSWLNVLQSPVFFGGLVLLALLFGAVRAQPRATA